MSVAVEHSPNGVQSESARARAGYGPTSGENEWTRLDAMHTGITQFLNGKLTPAPLEDFKPRRILELGAGSGAWAIQAAKTYPDAEVVASDVNPLPPRPLPPNLHFERADLTQPLPFEPASFDIVHLRFVLCHIPHGHTFLPAIAALVAPDGYLLLDDCNMPSWASGTGAPAVRACIDGYGAYMRANAQDPRFADALVSHVRALAGFAGVDALRVDFLVNDVAPDPAHQRLSEVFRESMRRIYTGPMAPAVAAFGLTPATQRACADEFDTPDWRAHFAMVLSWARRLPA